MNLENSARPFASTLSLLAKHSRNLRRPGLKPKRIAVAVVVLALMCGVTFSSFAKRQAFGRKGQLRSSSEREMTRISNIWGDRRFRFSSRDNADSYTGSCESLPGGGVEVQGSSGSALQPTGYPSLGSAFDAINNGAHKGFITIDLCADTIESTTARLNASGVGAASFSSVIIAPAGGAARTISGNLAAPLVEFNGADNVTVNGINAGGNTLTIANSSTSSTGGTSTVLFVNDAAGDSVQNAAILGSATGTNTATVIYGTTNGITGNDNDKIIYCNVGPAGSNLPLNGILGQGTGASPNNNAVISHNNIYDFFSATIDGSRGVLASTGSDAWSITDNSFYQTGARLFTAPVTVRVISIENASGNGFIVSGNYIGGNAPLAVGTWTYAGDNTVFAGIRLNVGTSIVSSVQNNTVRGLSMTTATASANSAVAVAGGSVNVGTDIGNTVGSRSATGSITFTNSGSGFFNGIWAESGPLGVLNVANNNIGGVTMSGPSFHSFRGVRVETGTAASITISSNFIGSNSLPDSIQTSSNSTEAALGISTVNATVPVTITGNTIANFTLTTVLTGAFRGIETRGNVNGTIVTNNTIRDIGSTSTATNSGSAPVIAGIFATGVSNGQKIEGNRLFNLASKTTGGASVSVVGILIGTAASSGSVNANQIYNFSTGSSSNTAIIRGIYLLNPPGNSPWNLTNNMIRLGSGVALNPIVQGINGGNATSAFINIWFNSIFLGGTQTAATVNTACVFKGTQVSGIDIRNNILWNARSSTGTPGSNVGRHYAIQAVNTNPLLTTNFNTLYASGNGGAIGFYSSDRLSLADWQAAIAGFDTNSLSLDPQFIDPANALAPDLHLQVNNPESGGAQSMPGVTSDADGQARSQPGSARPDIGADESDFVLSVDLQAPVITYSPLGKTADLGDRTLSVAITDNDQVPTTGLGLPAIYYRKNAAGYVTSQCTFTSGPNYDCRISAAALGGISVGDTVAYFVAAQDISGRIAVNPSIGAGGLTANPPAASTPPTSPNGYSIVKGFSGSVSVGSDQPITSLTNTGGLFDQINAGTVTGNVIVSLTTDLTAETGTVSLNQTTEEGAGAYSILVQPSGGARTISGSNTISLITLNGGDRVSFSGVAFGPLGLTIRNTSATTGAVLTWTNDASSNSLINCIVEGGNSLGASALLVFGAGATTGNDNNSVIDSTVRARTDVTGVPINLIASFNSNTVALNSNNRITGNRLTNFENYGFITSTTVNSENWTISNNDITQDAARSHDIAGINTGTMAGTNIISGNSLHHFINSEPGETRGFWIGSCGNLTLANNRIYDIQTTAASNREITGLLFTGGADGPANLTMVNNMFAIAPTITAFQSIIGIRDHGTAGGALTAVHNTIYIGGSSTSSKESWAYARTFLSPDATTLKNNFFYNSRLGGSSAQYGGDDQAGNTGSFVSDYNIFIGRHPSSRYMGYGMNGGGNVSFVEWQAGPPARDAHSIGIEASGVTVANQFVDVTSGDLHLKPTSLAVNAANPNFAVINDIDGNARDPQPDMGADEYVPSGAAGTLQFNNSAYSVGESGLTAKVTVIRTAGNTGAVAVNYAAIAGGTASGGSSCGAGVDYLNTSGTLNFADTESIKTFDIPICDDAVGEPDETILLQLTNPTGGATLGSPSSATLLITENDTAGRSFSIGDGRITEGNTGTRNLAFVVTYTTPADPTGAANLPPATVRFHTEDGTAHAAAGDFVPQENGLVTGTSYSRTEATTQSFTITIQVNGDFNGEPNEYFSVVLDNPIGATITRSRGIGLIVDDDRTSVGDLDSDRKTDYTVFRPSDGNWYTLNSSNGVFTFHHFGATGDIPVPGDYDGDGIVDFAVFRTAEGNWYVEYSHDNSFHGTHWGASGDRPVQADFDGDGKTDLAVFRDGVWYILQSSNGGVRGVQFGLAGDLAVPGDFDGDSSADLAIFRSGVWYLLRSSDNHFVAQPFGAAGDIPVVGDFDGDGRTDYTVFRNGTWYLLESLTNSFRAVQFGATGDRPIAGDYDGDGTSDIAVFRPSIGYWYVLRSSDNSFSATQWGQSGDIPLPAAYLPQ